MNSQTYYVILSHYDGVVLSVHTSMYGLSEALDTYMYEDDMAGLVESADSYRNAEGYFYDIYKCKSYLPTTEMDMDEWYSQTTDKVRLSIDDIVLD